MNMAGLADGNTADTAVYARTDILEKTVKVSISLQCMLN